MLAAPGIGYQIGELRAQRFGGTGVNHIYRDLDQLADAGWVEIYGAAELGPMAPRARRGSTRAYRVTPAGVAVLTAHLRSPLDESSAVSLTGDVLQRLRALPARDVVTLRQILEMCEAALRRLTDSQPVVAIVEASEVERLEADLIGDQLDALRSWLRGAWKRLATMEAGGR